MEDDVKVAHYGGLPSERTVPWGLDRIDQRHLPLDNEYEATGNYYACCNNFTYRVFFKLNYRHSNIIMLVFVKALFEIHGVVLPKGYNFNIIMLYGSIYQNQYHQSPSPLNGCDEDVHQYPCSATTTKCNLTKE